MFRFLRGVALSVPFLLTLVDRSPAAILTTGFFSGQILRFEDGGGPSSVFANVASGTDPFPGMSGIAIDPSNGRVFVTAQFSNRIYSFDSSGNALGFFQLPQTVAPSGLTIGSNGLLYVSGFGDNTVTSYNVANPSAFVQQNQISMPGLGPNGLAFDSNGRLLISTFNNGGVRVSNAALSSESQLVAIGSANGQIAVDANNNFYVGTAAVGSNVLKFDSNGNQIGNPWLTVNLPTPPLPFQSSDVTSPVGVALDLNGNVIVGALGQTNPTSPNDNFQSNGGLFRFDSNAGPLLTLGLGLSPISAVAVVPVPEPSALILVSLVGVLTLARRRNRTPA